MVKRINITLSQTTGLGTLQCVGGSSYACGGMVGFAYPADTTVQVADKKGTVHSQEFNNAEMPYSVLWIGQRGVYIHEWPNLEMSHGCIHLLSPNVASVYNWIDQATRIVLAWKP